MDATTAGSELHFIRTILERTQRRIDPHAFHFVWWGSIVLVWYPLGNLFGLLGEAWWQVPLGIVALVLGIAGSCVREARLPRPSRLPGENTFIGRQVVWAVAGCIGGGSVLSVVAPATGFVAGPEVPIVWALIYATLAFMVGVVYAREWMVSGGVIFLAALVAMFLPDLAGFIVGPVMGVGMIVPGVMAERRVARLSREAPEIATGGVDAA
jgi:hypothetical protein